MRDVKAQKDNDSTLYEKDVNELFKVKLYFAKKRTVCSNWSRKAYFQELFLRLILRTTFKEATKE